MIIELKIFIDCSVFFSYKHSSEISYGLKYWQEVYTNLPSLRFNAALHLQLLLQVYNIDVYKENLQRKGVSRDDCCDICGKIETLYHQLIVSVGKPQI